MRNFRQPTRLGTSSSLSPPMKSCATTASGLAPYTEKDVRGRRSRESLRPGGSRWKNKPPSKHDSSRRQSMAAQFLRWLRWAVLLGSSACWCLPFARGDEPAELFWSFRKLDRPALPRVKNVGRARTPVDFFVLAKLEAKGLTFAPDADPIMLVRRVFFDVIGLPPALDEVDAFLNDTAPGAYERLIDRLLASPHFGERWGRRWLDAAGYVDTVGFDIDLPNVMLG